MNTKHIPPFSVYSTVCVCLLSLLFLCPASFLLFFHPWTKSWPANIGQSTRLPHSVQDSAISAEFTTLQSAARWKKNQKPNSNQSFTFSHNKAAVCISSPWETHCPFTLLAYHKQSLAGVLYFLLAKSLATFLASTLADDGHAVHKVGAISAEQAHFSGLYFLGHAAVVATWAFALSMLDALACATPGLGIRVVLAELNCTACWLCEWKTKSVKCLHNFGAWHKF